MRISVDSDIISTIERKHASWVGEIAQKLRALTALPEVLSSIPSNHVGGSEPSIMRSGTVLQTYSQTEHCIHNKLINV